MKALFRLAFISLLFVSVDLNGQNSFKPGYIITNDNKEISGFADVKGWKQNPMVVNFRFTDTSGVVKLHPSEIKAFGAEGNIYMSAQVEAEMSPSGVDELLMSQYSPNALHIRAYNEANRVSTEKVIPKGEVKYQRGDSVFVLHPDNINASVFLQVLVKGRLNLLYFRDTSDKEHYYLSSEPGSYEELYRIFYADEVQAVQMIVYEVEYYKTLLLKYMAGTLPIETRIIKMNFTRKSLVDIFTLYNSMNVSTEQAL